MVPASKPCKPQRLLEVALDLGALEEHSSCGLLLGVAHVLGQPGERPVVRLRQVPVQDICDLLRKMGPALNKKTHKQRLKWCECCINTA